MSDQDTSSNPQDNVTLIDPEDVRAEYSALTSFFNTVITFRFTTLSLYLAAVGFIVSGALSKEKAALLLGMSVALWLLELRNRSLFYNLTERGIQIEREHWGYKGPKAYEPFYSHMMKIRPAREKDPEAPEPPPLDYPIVWSWKVKLAISHTKAFDLVYLFVILFALYSLCA
jgi:hypothetical protein